MVTQRGNQRCTIQRIPKEQSKMDNPETRTTLVVTPTTVKSREKSSSWNGKGCMVCMQVAVHIALAYQ